MHSKLDITAPDRPVVLYKSELVFCSVPSYQSYANYVLYFVYI